MKKLLLVLVLLGAVMLCGCLPEWLTPGEEEPEVPALEALVNADLVEVIVAGEETYWIVDWSIVNTGDKFIRKYILTFNVFYPMLTRDNVIREVTGKYLEIGEKHEEVFDLVKYDTPETVSVSWELFE